jgi:IS1 family transposase
MNRLSRTERAAIIRCLVEGNSIRSTSRMTGAARNTIATLLVELGNACADYQDRLLRNLTTKRVECDEIWSFVYARAKNVPEDKRGEFGFGDVWTFVAIDADTKLVPSWMIGGRDPETAALFMQDLASRLGNRVQLTTDGHRMYLTAVSGAFGREIDSAMLVKEYAVRYDELGFRTGTLECTGSHDRIVSGDPDAEYISTSYIERQDLTMRMGMRRFTRSTNGFSKKVENHAAMVSLHSCTTTSAESISRSAS